MSEVRRRRSGVGYEDRGILVYWHWMKVSIAQQENGITLTGRIWQDGSDESTATVLTATDTTPLAAGTVGLYCRDLGTICRYDDVTVTGPGGSIPGGGSPVFLKASPVFLKRLPDQAPDPGIPQD